MNIVTNNRPRNLLSGYELPEKAKADFDYLDDVDAADFVFYRGNYYDLGEFMHVPKDSDFSGWHGYTSDSFFSGVLIKLVDDQVIVGRYYC